MCSFVDDRRGKHSAHTTERFATYKSLALITRNYLQKKMRRVIVERQFTCRKLFFFCCLSDCHLILRHRGMTYEKDEKREKVSRGGKEVNVFRCHEYRCRSSYRFYMLTIHWYVNKMRENGNEVIWEFNIALSAIYSELLWKFIVKFLQFVIF